MGKEFRGEESKCHLNIIRTKVHVEILASLMKIYMYRETHSCSLYPFVIRSRKKFNLKDFRKDEVGFHL